MTIKELFKDRSSWTQGANAKGPHGEVVAFDDPCAVCWCLNGAIAKCYPGDHSLVLSKLRNLLNNRGLFWRRPDDRYCLVAFNDDSTYGEVMQLVEEADV